MLCDFLWPPTGVDLSEGSEGKSIFCCDGITFIHMLCEVKALMIAPAKRVKNFILYQQGDVGSISWRIKPLYICCINIQNEDGVGFETST